MTKLKHPFVSYGLVAFQFILIAALLFFTPIELHPIALPFQILAIFIGLWAVKTMHLGQFNIVPDPRSDTQIIASGPYRYIRHPMYLSILLFFFPGVLLQPLEPYLILYMNIIIVLWLKLHYEEQLLIEQIPEYTDYQAKTRKLIPFLF